MHHRQLRFTCLQNVSRKLPDTLRKSSERRRYFTDIVASESSEELRPFGDFLRIVVEIGALDPILYPFYHGRPLCERGIN
jgi:hypothetical protein